MGGTALDPVMWLFICKGFHLDPKPALTAAEYVTQEGWGYNEWVLLCLYLFLNYKIVSFICIFCASHLRSWGTFSCTIFSILLSFPGEAGEKKGAWEGKNPIFPYSLVVLSLLCSFSVPCYVLLMLVLPLPKRLDGVRDKVSISLWEGQQAQLEKEIQSWNYIGKSYFWEIFAMFFHLRFPSKNYVSAVFGIDWEQLLCSQ